MDQKFYQLFLNHPVVSTDTRNVVKDSIFFALRGANFDANTFALQALDSGAAYAVVDDKSLPDNDRLIKVPDVLVFMQKLAQHHRKELDVPVIGITGTNGKTTTKELMHAVLSKKYNVLATSGNFNNHLGVPLTLLRLRKEHELAIIEMGANHIGEIEFLSNICQPNYGIITNVGKAHLEGFGSYEGVIQAKTELYKHIARSNGMLFVNASDEVLMRHSEGIQRTLYGVGSDVPVDQSTDSFGRIQISLKVAGNQRTIPTQLFGSFNFSNIVCAYSIGAYFKVPLDLISEALSSYSPENKRSQIIQAKNNVIIMDAYNANPSSMELALRSFSELKSNKKMLVLGDMLELGPDEEKEHVKLVELAKVLDFQQVYLVGKIFSNMKSHSFPSFENVEALNKHLAVNFPNDFQILVKGSRGIKLEKVLEILQ